MLNQHLLDKANIYSSGNGGEKHFWVGNSTLTGEETKDIYVEKKGTYLSVESISVPKDWMEATKVHKHIDEGFANNEQLNSLLLKCKTYLENIVDEAVESIDEIVDDDRITQQNSFSLILQTLAEMWQMHTDTNQLFFDTLILVETASRITALTYLNKVQCTAILEVIKRIEEGSLSNDVADDCADLLLESGIDLNYPLRIKDEDQYEVIIKKKQ